MYKDEVLKILKASGDFVSGEAISSVLSVSRASVNNIIKELKKDGYQIESATNKGYRLFGEERLSKGEISAYLNRRSGELIFLESVDSTNKYLKNLSLDGAKERTCVVAKSQTLGKGRLGRSFLSLDGGIYLSYLYRPNTLTLDTANITSIVAVAVRRAIKSVCGLDADIKWVNDLLIMRKKICGILTEISVESDTKKIEYIIVGIGVNANQKQKDFLDLQDKATSLYEIMGEKVSISRLTAEIIKELDRIDIDNMCFDDYKAEYIEHNISLGRRVSVERGGVARCGVSTKINDDFSLEVRFDDGATESISFGEVKVEGLY